MSSNPPRTSSLNPTYHSNEDIIEFICSLTSTPSCYLYPLSIGKTVQGRSILGVYISSSALSSALKKTDKVSPLSIEDLPSSKQQKRPIALLSANMHGVEIIGSEVALHCISLFTHHSLSLLLNDLLKMCDVVIIPSVNLDGRAQSYTAWKTRTSFKALPRGNANGVDLNRNFPLSPYAPKLYSPLAGTSIKWLPWYRGTHALSEPESQAIAHLSTWIKPISALHLHSVGNLILYPYAYASIPPKDLDAFLRMGTAFQRQQDQLHSKHPLYTLKQSHAWYGILGDLDDWLYDTFGTLSITVELGSIWSGLKGSLKTLSSPFYWMNPEEVQETFKVEVQACLAALKCGVEEGLKIRKKSES